MLVLKELSDLSDPQTAEALKSGIRWKVACGRSLTQMSFDPSTLVYWRKRIAASDRPDRVFGMVAEVIAQTGILRGRGKRCVDSTVFDDATVILSRAVVHGCDLVFCVVDSVADAAWEPVPAPVGGA